MAAFLPFETAPALGVAVSGGRDSLALTLLAADWVAAAGGRLVALTVDHRLRPDSASEAGCVGDWLAAQGIAHRTLAWHGPHPHSGIQAAARAARYRLLETYCAEHGILHLLLGHQREDQSETVRMRRIRQATGDGLAGMTALRETAHLRILRPLLAFPRARLAATLTARGQAWFDDPSNENPAYERSRVRAALADGALVPPAHDSAARRRASERAATAALARCVSLLPEGFARIDAAAFAACPAAVRRDVLAHCVITVGGKPYAPRGMRLDRLVDDLAADRLGRGRTLGGCRILPAAGSGGAAWLVVREAPRDATPAGLAPGGTIVWDGRFDVGAAASAPTGLSVAPLRRDGWRRIAGDLDAVQRARLPAPARPSLPAVWHDGRIVGVPVENFASKGRFSLRFSPLRALSDAGFVPTYEKTA